MFPNQGSWNPCGFCTSLWEFSPFRMRLGTSSEPHHTHLRKRGGCPWCLEPVAPGFPSENGCVCGFKFLGLSSLVVGFIGTTPKSEVFKRDSDGWAFLQKSVMRITVKDYSSCFCPFPFTLFLFTVLNAIAEHFVSCLNQHNFHCIEKLVSSAHISLLF